MEIRTAKGRLFLLLSVIILFPMAEHCFNFIIGTKLQGYFEQHPDVHFTPQKWWDGSYQKEKTLYLNDSVGFRPDLVRMNNQLGFTFFNMLYGTDTYVGHDNNLFSAQYINEYEGRTHIADSLVRKTMIKLRRIQDTLEHLGKTLVFTYAPSKPYYMPENLPDIFQRYGAHQTSNYTTFRRLSDSLGIRQIDFNALFIAMKDTSRGTLFTKQGLHWSFYGSLLAADTLIKFIDRARNIRMQDLVITRMAFSDDARGADNDLANCTNLIFPVTKEKFCYPEYHFTTDSARTKPSAIFVGDSFIWSWMGNGFIQGDVRDWQYWYYFNEVWDVKAAGGQGQVQHIPTYNWQKKMMGTDCIVIVYTAPNLGSLCEKGSFIERMYSLFYPGQK